MELKKPKQETYTFTSLTPFHTGGTRSGVSDAFHPSGFLGSLRYFSTGLAKALGLIDFETKIWGKTGQSQSKAVSLSWDDSEVKTIEKDLKVSAGKGKWFFSSRLEGRLTLTLTQVHPLEEHYWQLLNIAILFQSRYATWGAKDQFGLGVLQLEPHKFKPDFDLLKQMLPANREAQGIGFYTALFAHIPIVETIDKYKAGLYYKSRLRNLFREDNETSLRHAIFGSLGESASAIQVSAAYQQAGQNEIRLWITLPHTNNFNNHFANRVNDVVNRIKREISKPLRADEITTDFLNHELKIIDWNQQDTPASILNKIKQGLQA